jgi:hypothetical protein
MTLKTKNVAIKRWWDFWAVIMMLAAISLIGLRLWATAWTGELYILVYLTFLAGVSGLALGYSRFPAIVTVVISAIYGLFFTSWLFGSTVTVEMSWRDRILNDLAWRLRLTIQQFNAGEAVTDPILFLTLMAILLWALGSITAFILARRRALWAAIIPLGITLLIIGHYDPNLARNTRFLMAFLFFTLLLMGRLNFIKHQEQWEKEGVHTTYETQMDFAKATVLLVSVLLVTSWLIPITPQQTVRYSEIWQRLTEPIDTFRENVSDLFVIENPTSFSSTSFYGESMGLGSGSPSSEEIVFSIQMDGEPIPGWRNYWKARSYDFFDGSEWSTGTGLTNADFFPETYEIHYPDWQTEHELFLTWTTSMRRIANIYTTGLPRWIDRPIEATLHTLGDSEEDLIALIADPPLPRGTSYQIETWINVPTINELRYSETDYPDWASRYLRLPPDFSSDIKALAEDITEGMDNPYDKTDAITQFLRDNIAYSRILPETPKDADLMAWFLFDAQTGFCNYYASAQVLMLRALGIPARMAVGYAEGEFNPETNTYIVRKKDSHAWPEVYFEGYGWVAFEPTVSQSPLSRPLGTPPTSGEDEPGSAIEESPGILPPLDPGIIIDDGPEESLADNAENQAEPVRRVSGLRVIWGILITFLILLAVTILILIKPTYFKINIDPLPVLLEKALIKHHKKVPGWLQQWSYLAQMSAAERAYGQLSRSLKLLGKVPSPSETPGERVQNLISILPEASQPGWDIINEYHLDTYSDHIVNEERAKKAARQIRKMAWQTFFRQFFHVKK